MVRSGKIALLASVLLPLILLVPCAARATSLTLHWTAPGDDSLTGTAARYELRYWLFPIDQYSWGGATLVPNMPAPGLAGTRQEVVVRDLIPDAVYYFGLKTVDDRGNWSGISNIVMVAGDGRPAGALTPGTEISLGAPAPNPARSATRLAYSLPLPGRVRMDVLDLLGRRVRTLLAGEQAAGPAEVVWNLDDDQGRPVPAGIYLVHARFEGAAINRRIAVVR